MDYRRKIYAIRDLPTIPAIAQKILAIVDKDDTAADKMAKIIESDQSLTVRILSLANSAYYGRRAQIATVKQAVVVIGWVMLKQVSLGVLMSKALGVGKNRLKFWRHSLMTAHAASIAMERSGSRADVAFIGGLLHDVGKLVLDSTLPDEYQKVQALLEESGSDVVAAERSIFETDHVEVGAWMAERWQFPPELVAAIRLHHTAETPTGPHAKLIASVFVANAVVHAAEAQDKDPENPVSIEVPECVGSIIGASPERLVEISAELERRKKDIERLLV